jgi:phosphonate transport system substrate-binding protein
MIFKRFSILFTLAFLPLLQFCSDAPVGSKSRPFTMYFVPSVDAQKIATSSEGITKFVAQYVSQKLYGKDEGFYVKGAIPASYIAVVEAFGTKKADFAAFNTFSYVLAKDIKKYPVEAVFLTERNDGEITYKGQIIARADSGIKSLEDLKGKKFAYTDPASTSGFILPAKLLRDKGIELSDSVFAQKHDNVVTMVYQKQVDAGATYYSSPEEKVVDGRKVSSITDARARVKTQFPDVEDKIRVIGYTQEIPNEPWVIRSNLFEDAAENKKIKDLVAEGVLEFTKTEPGKQALRDLATGTGLHRASDEIFAEVRQIFTSSNLNLEEIISKTK